TLLAVLLPAAGGQAAFDVDLGALAQILAGDLGEAAEADHVVPLRAFLLLAALAVAPVLAGGDAEFGDGVAALGIAGFRVCAQIADEDDLVDPPSHSLRAPDRSMPRVYPICRRETYRHPPPDPPAPRQRRRRTRLTPPAGY